LKGNLSSARQDRHRTSRLITLQQQLDKIARLLGALEGPNVNAVHEMSSLVAATRAYDQVANTILREDDKNELRKLAGEDL
jgi:flagellar basal-body rod protein FlgF